MRRLGLERMGGMLLRVCKIVWMEQLARMRIRSGIAVLVRPQLVVEIALDGVQSSTRYPGGVALRFARVKRYRPDKPADEADTIDELRALLPQRL